MKLFTDKYVCGTCGVIIEDESQEMPRIRLKPHLTKCPLCETYSVQRLPKKTKGLKRLYRIIAEQQ